MRTTFCLLMAGTVSFGLTCGCTPTSQIRIDGSSTVFPITEAVAEEFRKEHSAVHITVSYSGTGGGMKKFWQGEIDICDASRPIKENEREACRENGIEFIEFPIAIDGLAVIVHPENDWCDCLTVAQLKELWRPGSPIKNWSDLDPSWPDEEIKLYGPGTDSGTFDYFTEVIVGEEKASRADFTQSENDNVLVTGVQADKYALCYFGYAYYEENKQQLKLLAVDGGNGVCVQPSVDKVRDNTYAPLSRPLFIYVSKKSLARPEVVEFVRYYLAQVDTLSADAGYVPVNDETATKNRELLDDVLATSAATNVRTTAFPRG